MHGLVLKALQAVCLLLGFLVLRSVVFVARLFYARWSYSNSKAFSKIPGPPPAKLVIGGSGAPGSGCVVLAHAQSKGLYRLGSTCSLDCMALCRLHTVSWAVQTGAMQHAHKNSHVQGIALAACPSCLLQWYTCWVPHACCQKCCGLFVAEACVMFGGCSHARCSCFYDVISLFLCHTSARCADPPR